VYIYIYIYKDLEDEYTGVARTPEEYEALLRDLNAREKVILLEGLLKVYFI
jgi:hypothetical protein